MSAAKRLDRAQLRIWTPDEGEGEAERVQGSGSRQDQRIWTVESFFEGWFLPVVLLGGEEEADPKTIALYRDAVRWWTRLMGGLELATIDQLAIAEFKQRLKTATYTRGVKLRTLSQATRQKHLAHLRAILARTGPTFDPKRPAAGFLEATPHVLVGTRSQGGPKPCFPWETARRIAAAVGAMSWSRPRIDGQQLPACTAALWWRAWLYLAFYTGLRFSTLFRLRWEKVQTAPLSDGATESWVFVPAPDVSKTHKQIRQFLRAEALAACALIREGEFLLPRWPYSGSHHYEEHRRLQQAAGLAEHELLDRHAWRRTYGVEMAKVGAPQALEAARQALDHADTATTRGHYVDVTRLYIPRLPLLDDGPPATAPAPRQRLLFE